MMMECYEKPSLGLCKGIFPGCGQLNEVSLACAMSIRMWHSILLVSLLEDQYKVHVVEENTKPVASEC